MSKEILTRQQFLMFAGTVLGGGVLAACTPGGQADLQQVIRATQEQLVSTVLDTQPALTALDPVQTETPQPASTATVSSYLDHQPQVPSPTSTFSPTMPITTPLPTESLEEGLVQSDDVLTVVQKHRLWLASLQYIADTQGISQFIQSHLPNTSRNSTDEPHSITQWTDQENR